MKNNNNLVFYLINLLIVLSLFSCHLIEQADIPEIPYGTIKIRIICDDSSIFDEFVHITETIIRFTNETLTHTHAIELDTTSMGSTYTLTEIPTGDYDISVLLYGSEEILSFITEDNISIEPGDNGEKQMPPLQRYESILILSGIVDEDIPDLQLAASELIQGDTIINIDMLLDGNTINGTSGPVYPGEYGIRTTLLDSVSDTLFLGHQHCILTYGVITGIITLDTKTGTIAIGFEPDVLPPEIIGPPHVTITGIDACIEWQTDSPGTSNICYSEQQNFDYTNTLYRVPEEIDIFPDTIDHDIIISDLTEKQTYYYVIYTTDYCGNMTVSSEFEFFVESLSAPQQLIPSGNITWDFETDFTFTWEEPIYTGSGISCYQIFIDDDPAFESTMFEMETTNRTIAINNGYGEFIRGDYYWKVVAIDTSERSTPSLPVLFSVADHPPSSSLYTPSTNTDSCFGDTLPTFAWHYYDHDYDDILANDDFAFYLYIDDDTTPFTGADRIIFIKKADLDHIFEGYVQYVLAPEYELQSGVRYSWGLDCSSDNGVTWKRSSDTLSFSVCD